jgi:hypothetical protein
MTIAVPIVVNLLKRLGIIEDGTSDQWHRGLQLLAFVVIGGATAVFSIDYGPIDVVVTQIANIIAQLLQLGVLFKVGPMVHYNILRGTPVVGKSFTLGATRYPFS